MADIDSSAAPAPDRAMLNDEITQVDSAAVGDAGEAAGYADYLETVEIDRDVGSIEQNSILAAYAGEVAGKKI